MTASHAESGSTIPATTLRDKFRAFLIDGQSITGNLYTFSELTDDDDDPTTPDVEGEFRDIDRFVYSHPYGSIDVTVLSEADTIFNIGNLKRRLLLRCIPLWLGG